MEVINRNSANTALDVTGFMNKVYMWMALGLVLSAVSAYYIASDEILAKALVQNQLLQVGLVLLQIGLVVGLSFMMPRLSVMAARGIYLGYTLLTGVTLSIVLLAFTAESVMNTFLVTAGSFAGLSFFGYVTQRDLGPVGSFCIMGLVGLFILMLASLFIPGLRGDTMQLFMGAAGVIIFSGLTAYDTQKIKTIYLQNQGDASKLAIFGALTLFLDFINLFLSLLRLMGERR